MEKRADVIIIGAGPVGLTLAINLKRLGLSVHVIDKAPQTKREQRACVIWSRSTEILADLGLIDDFVAASATLNRATVYANGRHLGAMTLGSSQSPYPRPLVIEQNTIEHLLAVHLARLCIDVEWQAEATDIVEVDQSVYVTLTHADGRQEIIEGQWVVGCEGTRSMLREKMGIVFEGRKRSNLQALQVNACQSKLSEPQAEIGQYRAGDIYQMSLL
jgi:2-polyprenyl-6-methoxyphenol hydroxylase-like FAD-dependent oxidoreductase